MVLNRLSRGVITLLVPFVLCTGGGAAVAQVVLSQDEGAPSTDKSAAFQVNERGMTYGSAASSDHDPDLIYAIGDHGKKGYVLAVDLNGKTPTSPEEAVAMTLAQDKGTPPVIPLYESDGVTQIDTFTLSKTTEVDVTDSGR